MLLQNVIAFTSIGLVCALLNLRRSWIVKASAARRQAQRRTPRFHSIDSPAAAVQPYPIKQEENPVMNNDAPQTLDAAGSRVADWNSSSGCRTKAFPGWHSGAWSWSSRC